MVTPPNDTELVAYKGTDRLRLYTFGVLSFLSLLTGMLFFVMAHPGFLAYSAIAILVTFYLITSYVVGIFGRDFDWQKHHELCETFSQFKPTIDVFYCCCGEDVEIIGNTLKHIKAMAEDYGDKMRVYVLDDGADEFVDLIAQRYKFNYFVRDDRPNLKKAGNLRHAFAKTQGEFIMVFDADFCPRPDMPSHLLPYMAADENVGIVQSPQFFILDDAKTWVSKGAVFIQELFYRLINVNRDTFDGSICVGTNALYRRSTLQKYGGTAAVEYSEDVRTGFRATRDLWKVRYIPVCLAKGLCPDQTTNFFIQQYRWAMGSIDLFLSKEFWTQGLTFMQRVCYLSGMFYYITTGLMLIFGAIPALLVLLLKPEAVHWYNFLFAFPSLIYGTVYTAIWTRTKWGTYAMKVRQLSYYSHLMALFDSLSSSTEGWVPTAIARKTKRYVRFQLFCFWWTTTITVLMVGLIGYRMHQGHIYDFVPTLCFVMLNFWLNFSILRDQV